MKNKKTNKMMMTPKEMEARMRKNGNMGKIMMMQKQVKKSKKGM